MTPELLTGASLLINVAILAAWVILRVPQNKRRMAAWLWASAKADEEKVAAWRKIEQDAKDYESKLLRRAEGEEARLIQMGE